RGGAGLRWPGDLPGPPQRRTASGRPAARRPPPKGLELPGRVRAHPAARAARAERPGGLVGLVEPDLPLALRRAPDLAGGCREAYGELSEPAMVSLNELLGVLSAWQWQQRGVPVPALGDLIHPRYGVFSPVRSEYVDLVAEAPL